MNKYLYLQQQIEQTLPPVPPSPLPVFSIPFHSHSCSASGPSSALPARVTVWVRPPQKPRKGGQGGAWLRAGWGVSFHILLFSKPGGQQEEAPGAVRGREAHSPAWPSPRPHVPAASPNFHSVPQPRQLVQERFCR